VAGDPPAINEIDINCSIFRQISDRKRGAETLFLLAHNWPADFRSAANVASDITSVNGLLPKGTAP
jgi:hypothetical protein